MAEYDDLASFDDAFTPQQSSNFRPGLDALAPGSYDFTILSAALDITQKSQDRILRVELRVEQTAQVIEHCYFFQRQESVDRLGGDLATLGFDVGLWKPPHRPFSKELPRALVQLPGRRFKGTKAVNPAKDNSGKLYHNLWINSRLPDGAVPPTSSGQSPPATGQSADSIPF